MSPPGIIHRSLFAGVRDVSGAVIVIDTFRAFTTAAFLLDRGVSRIVLTETLDEARGTASTLPGSILCGEDGGRQPADFPLGNSPTQVDQADDLRGRTVVMRTSSGTRSVVGALRSGAEPVYAASLVVASATARAVGGYPQVTIVASGLGGTVIADEDEETAGFIADRLLERPDDPRMIDRIRAGTGAARLRTTPWIDPHDLDRCLETDRFSFALRASTDLGLVLLNRTSVTS